MQESERESIQSDFGEKDADRHENKHAQDRNEQFQEIARNSGRNWTLTKVKIVGGNGRGDGLHEEEEEEGLALRCWTLPLHVLNLL